MTVRRMTVAGNTGGLSPSADIDAAFATGSFPVVLRTAIAATGLSLDRVRYRLQERGVVVSVPTLSNWQSGRRRPERAESLLAVAELEHVLRLSPGTLCSLLRPPKPRGRPTTPGPFTATWGRAGARLLSTLDTLADARLRRLSHHDTVTVGPAGRLVRVRSRLVFRAREDGADRWIDAWHTGPGEQTAAITTQWQCGVGRLKVDHGARLSAAELVLDLPLARDATAIAEYQLDFPGSGGPGGRFFRRFALPVREYVMEIRFDPTGAPPRCRRGNSRTVLAPSRSGSVHLVELDAIGLVDLTWDS